MIAGGSDRIQVTGAGWGFQMATSWLLLVQNVPCTRRAAHARKPDARGNTHLLARTKSRRWSHNLTHAQPRKHAHAQAVHHLWCNYSLSAANLKSHLLTFSYRQRLIHSQLRSYFSSGTDIFFSPFVHHSEVFFFLQHFLKHWNNGSSGKGLMDLQWRLSCCCFFFLPPREEETYKQKKVDG